MQNLSQIVQKPSCASNASCRANLYPPWQQPGQIDQWTVCHCLFKSKTFRQSPPWIQPPKQTHARRRGVEKTIQRQWRLKERQKGEPIIPRRNLNKDLALLFNNRYLDENGGGVRPLRQVGKFPALAAQMNLDIWPPLPWVEFNTWALTIVVLPERNGRGVWAMSLEQALRKQKESSQKQDIGA